MTRTYTGPLPSGETVTVTCPDWCQMDHGDDPPIDIFHRSGTASIVPPPDLLWGGPVRQMTVHLVVPAVPQDGDRPVVAMDLDDKLDRHTELDVTQADDLIAQLDNYRTALVMMRDYLVKATGGVPSEA